MLEKTFREVSLGTVLEQGLQTPERGEHKSVLLRGNCDLQRANTAFYKQAENFTS